MRIAFLINDYQSLKATMTTSMLMEAASKLNHEVWIFTIGDWLIPNTGKIMAKAKSYPAIHKIERNQQLEILKENTGKIINLTSFDLLFIRTNPARDPNKSAHDTSLDLAARLEEFGVLVLNSPLALRKAASKLYLMNFPPEIRPESLIARDKDSLKTFIKQKGEQDTVVKPLSGTRGRNVFRLNPVNNANHNQIIEILQEEGYIIAQEFLPEAKDGDTRVIVINGEILEHQGKVAAIRRLPPKGDFRSNLHAGGTARPAQISVQMRRAVEMAKPRLLADGLFMVGLDFIGNKIIELNVFSPGGFRDAERFADFSFSTRIIEKTEKMVEKNKKNN
ncbi:MAG: hypothetical protein PF689_08545 [Deltaproteobacteria bacterium]|jgi:glutathione synthase|nr:hypothetical protein [Deltaproteobacteria bacterium]